jgi:hypothetical protein
MDTALAARLDLSNAALGAVVGALVGHAYLQWGLQGLYVTVSAAFVFALVAGLVSGGGVTAAE